MVSQGPIDRRKFGTMVGAGLAYAATAMSRKDADGEAIAMPDVVLGDAERIVVDGLVIDAKQQGASEAVGLTTYFFPAQNILVSGDVATPDYLPFMLEGRTSLWLAQLERIRQDYTATVNALPGHGPAGNLHAMVDGQASYLARYRERITQAISRDTDAGAGLSAPERAEITRAMAGEFVSRDTTSALPLNELTAKNADAVAKELRG